MGTGEAGTERCVSDFRKGGRPGAGSDEDSKKAGSSRGGKLEVVVAKDKVLVVKVNHCPFPNRRGAAGVSRSTRPEVE